jgi:hypothetical protein
MIRSFSVFILVAISSASWSATPRLPDNTPYCALPGARALFVSPMGEPFRGEAGRAYPSAAWFTRADRNSDGTLDRIEFIADADRFFRTLDRDHDGKLEPEEVIAYENVIAPEIALYGPRSRDVVILTRGRPRNGESGYGGPMGAGRYTWLNIPEPVAATDADFDRTISAREFAAAAGQRFDLLDAGSKGRIALKDLVQTPLQQSLEGPCRPRPKPKKRSERGFGPNPDDPNAELDRTLDRPGDSDTRERGPRQ